LLITHGKMRKRALFTTHRRLSLRWVSLQSMKESRRASFQALPPKLSSATQRSTANTA